MVRYLIRRVLWAAMLFLVITVVTFVIFFMIPVNPAKQACGQRATATCIKSAEKTLGLDKPIHIQYLKFMDRLVIHHNLGKSFVTRRSVNTLVLNAAPVTATLVFGGAFFWMLIALPIGILSALKPRSLLDRASMVFVLIGISAHPVWIGLIFSYVFGAKLGWTPITGYCDFFQPLDGLRWSSAVGVAHGAAVGDVRDSLRRALRADDPRERDGGIERGLRAHGALEGRTGVDRHSLAHPAQRTAPGRDMLGMDIGVALGGAIFTENVYSLPGLGQTGLDSINSFDLPVTQGIIVFATLAIIVFNLVVDLLYAVIDPRIRLS